MSDEQQGQTKLSREDYLEIENSSLKIRNYVLQAQELKKSLEEASKALLEQQQAHRVLLTGLSEKYGMDLKMCQINPDGTIEPHPKR